MKYISLLFLFSFNLYGAVCLEPHNAQVYYCQPTQDKEQDQLCQEKFGETYHSYFENQNCNLKMAAEMRGEEFQEELPTLVEAACFTHEKATQLGCEEWTFEPALDYCSQVFSAKYIPHYPKGKCSVERAEQEFGFISGDELVEGLKEDLAQANAILTMIDREGVKDSLGGLISTRPAIGNDFYTPVMKGLLAKMNEIKNQLEHRSQQKIKFSGARVKEFLISILTYIDISNRINKVYAYVAHRNHKKLETYKFEDLSFLNLRLGKPMAMEVLNRINLKAKTVADEVVELSQSEQNKQMYEYLAIAEPDTAVDYAKLISFLGIRENTTNLWALDRMSERDLLNKPISSCGPFLNFNERMKPKRWAGISENIQYDYFINDYLNRQEDLSAALLMHQALDRDNISLVQMMYESVPGFRVEVENYHQRNGLNIEEGIKQYFLDDLQTIINATEKDRFDFVVNQFRSIILPSDNILDVEHIKETLAAAMVKRQIVATIDGFYQIYPLFSEADQELVEVTVKNYFRQFVTEPYKSRLKTSLSQALEGYGKKSIQAKINREEKIDHTFETAKKYAKYAKLSVRLKGHIQGYSTEVQPTDMQQLLAIFENKTAQEFQDLKLSTEVNPHFAKTLEKFFGKVTEKFKQSIDQESLLNELEDTRTDTEKTEALYVALFETAKEFYAENKFDIIEEALVPEATLLSRDQEELLRNPFFIQIYRDGTPVVLHVDDFYKAFEEKIVDFKAPVVSKVNSTANLLGLSSIQDKGSRDHEGKKVVTAGYFGMPKNYYGKKGTVLLDNVSSDLDHNALQRLYKQSLGLTRQEIITNHNFRKEQKLDREDLLKDEEIIQSTQELYARVFELFRIPMADIVRGDISGKKEFDLSPEDKRHLVKGELSKAYGEAILLSNHLETTEIVKKKVCTGSFYPTCRMKENEEVISRPLIEKIAVHAYDLEVDEVKAKALIEDVIKQAETNIPGKLESFCLADYMNYKKNANFRKAFKSAEFLRRTLRSDSGTTISNSRKIQQLDSQVAKEIRTKWEVWNEDYLEPVLFTLGMVTLVAVGVMLSLSSFGTAAPAAIGSISAYIGMFLSASNYVFLPLVIATTYTRVNHQFIEVPAQLKFQTSLAHSQISEAKITEYEQIEQMRSDNKFQQVITVGLLPLDLFFGYSVVQQVRTGLGVSGVKSFNKLTGVSLKGFAKPADGLAHTSSYADLRRSRGRMRSAIAYAGQRIQNAKMYLPRYQAVPESMIRTQALRVGIARKLREIGLAKKPWEILGDVKSYTQRMQSRLSEYKTYVEAEAKEIAKFQLNSRMHMAEVMEFGVQNTKFGFTIKSFFAAIFKGKLKSYLDNYGELIVDLKKSQGEFVKNKIRVTENALAKLEEFQKLHAGSAGDDLIDDMLKYLTDDELLALERVAKKSAGPLRSLKPVFKQYQNLVQSLRPVSYLYGHSGHEFSEKSKLASNFLSDDKIHNYTYSSDSEDIVLFYESILRQNAFLDESSEALRRQLEERISRLFTLDAQGNRIYID